MNRCQVNRKNVGIVLWFSGASSIGGITICRPTTYTQLSTDHANEVKGCMSMVLTHKWYK